MFFVSICGPSREENVRANGRIVELTDEEFKSIKGDLEENKTVGDGAYPDQRKYLEGQKRLFGLV